MEPMAMPFFVEVFIAPVRDNGVTQTVIVAALALMVLDIVFGMINAIAHKNFSSTVMRRGLTHKCAALGFMLVGVVIDGTISAGIDLGYQAPVLTGLCVYIIIMEISSLLETFAAMNPAWAGSAIFKFLQTSTMMDIKNSMSGTDNSEKSSGAWDDKND